MIGAPERGAGVANRAEPRCRLALSGLERFPGGCYGRTRVKEAGEGSVTSDAETFCPVCGAQFSGQETSCALCGAVVVNPRVAPLAAAAPASPGLPGSGGAASGSRSAPRSSGVRNAGGPPAAAPWIPQNRAPDPGGARSHTVKTLAIAVVAVLVLGGGGYLAAPSVLRWFEPPVPVDAVPLEPPPWPTSRVFDDRLPLGGRTISWWEDQLVKLRARQDPEGQRLFALTKKRAEANGLRIVPVKDAIRVEPSEELLTALEKKDEP